MSPESNDVLEIQQQAILETKVTGPITVGQIVAEVAENYDFNGQKPKYLSPLSRGLETRKYTFWTRQDAHLLKIYDQSASTGYRFRLRNVVGLERKLKAADIPIAESELTKKGNHFLVIDRRVTPSRSYEVAFAVSKVFPGRALTAPSLEDVQKMAEYMARIHQIKDYGVVPAMDSWSFLRFIRDNDIYSYPVPIFYAPKFVRNDLKDVLEVIAPIVKNLRALDLENEKKFPKTLIHGDLHPFNILKGKGGKFCILDLGCMDYQQRIADLAIFMSNTCADFTDLEKTKRLFTATVEAYESHNHLTREEKEGLSTLIQANYAMFSLRTAELLQKDPDNKEVREWHEHGLNGLKMMEKILRGRTS